jgi:hypothetical protein
MNKFKPGDKFVTGNGTTGKIVKICWNSILGEDEYIVTWDHMPGAGECSYVCSEVESEWQHKMLTGVRAVIKVNGQPVAYACDPIKVSHGIGGFGRIEEIKEFDGTVEMSCTMTRGPCEHEWVDIGFAHSKMVCKKCDKEKV